MKEKFMENGIENLRNGDCYISNISVPDDKVYNIGKYGKIHAKFIKENTLHTKVQSINANRSFEKSSALPITPSKIAPISIKRFVLFLRSSFFCFDNSFIFLFVSASICCCVFGIYIDSRRTDFNIQIKDISIKINRQHRCIVIVCHTGRHIYIMFSVLILP